MYFFFLFQDHIQYTTLHSVIASYFPPDCDTFSNFALISQFGENTAQALGRMSLNWCLSDISPMIRLEIVCHYHHIVLVGFVQSLLMLTLIT